jgi:hypothetical protein
VTVRLRGTQRLYRARLDTLAELRELLEAFWGQRLGGLPDVGDGGPAQTTGFGPEQ